MSKLIRIVVVGLFAVSLFAMQGDWQGGIQTSFARQDWPGLLASLQAARPDRAPYHITKRTRAYDYDLRIVTPFSAAAAAVQKLHGSAGPATYDTVAGPLSATRLTVELQTMHRSVEGAEAVLLALKGDGKMIQPLGDRIESSQLRSVGFYAEPFYQVRRTFWFDLAQVAAVKKLSVVIFESDSKQVEVRVDVPKLR